MMMVKRCLKFEGYLFVPNAEDGYKDLRHYSAKTMGRIRIFDENNKPVGKMYAFDNVGQMLAKVMGEYEKRAMKRLPTKRMIVPERQVTEVL